MHIIRSPATAVLIAINLVIFFSMASERTGDWPASFLVTWGGNVGRLTLHGEAWRLVSAMFLHGSFTHIAGNLICLLVWGSVTESAFGTVRFLLAYFVSGVLANLVSAWVHPNVVSVGASGAIAGILGLMVVMWLKGDHRVSPKDLVANIALNTFLSLQPSVNWVAHVAGFATGLGLGPFLFKDSLVRRAPPPDLAAPTFEELGLIRAPATSVSFHEPMDFPKGTNVYRTRSRLVAILPDWKLIADNGAAGVVFATARDYRDKTGDEGEWTLVREFSEFSPAQLRLPSRASFWRR
jgi:membrane associated rhomboid family serine protease